MAHLGAIVSGAIGNFVSFLVFFAPVTTFRQVYRRKTTAGFSSLPYVVALFSSALWIFYAHVKTDSHLLLSINSVGCAVEAVYIALFVFYAPRRDKARTGLSILLGCAALGLVVGVSLKGLAPRHRVKFLGSVCLAFSLAVFVAPLSVIVKVVKTRSVEFLPISLSFCLVLSAVAWFLYGFFTKDHFVMYPNVAGFVFSCIQVALYFWFRNPKNNNPQNNDGAPLPPPPQPQNGGEPPGAQGEILELAAV
ncbi:hypothetical protein QOZ80_8AG0638710 [Eleusine coracana subsp. coracana]|nr:hypothetical protein QOZ80_8AG0638710 [Eleusine coracana subsp. coracana]